MRFATARGRGATPATSIDLSQLAIVAPDPALSAAGTGGVRRMRRGRDARRPSSNRVRCIVSNWSAARFSRRYS